MHAGEYRAAAGGLQPSQHIYGACRGLLLAVCEAFYNTVVLKRFAKTSTSAIRDTGVLQTSS